jgi:hypothetical protein
MGLVSTRRALSATGIYCGALGRCEHFPSVTLRFAMEGGLPDDLSRHPAQIVVQWLTTSSQELAARGRRPALEATRGVWCHP